MKQPRPEQVVFDELATVCATPGFAHVVAALCARDNFTWYRREMRAEDMQHLYSRSRLIRTEMSTLIGLMVRSRPDCDAPPPANAAAVAARTEALLAELHDTMTRPWGDAFRAGIEAGGPPEEWRTGDAMREPIFYGGEGAFSFQNCDFAMRKYAADDAWLLANKGATIADMVAVAQAIGALQTEGMTEAFHDRALKVGDDRPLRALTFETGQLVERLDLAPKTIQACVEAFAIPAGQGNPGFAALHDFNAAAASPIIGIDGGRHVLFHFNALAEALYESPFYWLGADCAYAPTASRHRGDFTEAFSLERLTAVFGDARVHRGVEIERGKGNRVGEIDVLVLFGDRAMVLQAKSKRLTMEARRGNDLQIRDDFRRAVQDAYDQAIDCSASLLDRSLRFVDSSGEDLGISKLSQVFPICVVADHYPALAFQTEQFLVTREVERTLAPLVVDVFTLDAMAEMLDRPLRFLSYLELRSLHGARVQIHHEITLLSYHLKYNLWLDDEFDFVALEDDFAADLEIALGARRLGLPGRRTPAGILTILAGRALDGVIREIEASPFGPMIDLVMLLYQLSGDAMKQLLDGLDAILVRARLAGRSDFSMGFAGTGLTLHANRDPRHVAEPKLEWHVALRKYRQRAGSWYGLSLDPADGSIRFGKKADFPWRRDAALEREALALGAAPDARRSSPPAGRAKLGRNELCHCGSGRKYKQCHLRADMANGDG